MNVRPADSSALAADKFASATDLLSATAACRELGPIPFERMLRDSQAAPVAPAHSPGPASRADANRSAPHGSNEERRHADAADSSRADESDPEQPPAPSAEAQRAAEPATASTAEPVAEAGAVAEERPHEEGEESEQDFVAESLLLAAAVPAEQSSAAPDSKSSAEPVATAEIIADFATKPIDGESPTLAAVRADQGASTGQVDTAAELEPPPADAGDTAAELEVAAPPSETDATAEEPAQRPSLPSGIGVLPSALNQEAQGRLERSPSANHRSRTAQRVRDVTPEREAVEATGAETQKPDIPHDEVIRRTDRGEAGRFRVQAGLDVAPPTSDPSAALRMPATSEVAVVVEQGPAVEVAATSTGRADGIASRSSESIPTTAQQPNQSLVTPQLTSRLPTHALVRGSQHLPATEQGSSQIDTVRILQRVARAFEAAREQGGEIRLRLSPPELGALRVEVNVIEQGLIAKVEAETPEARAILLENLPALRERLAEQGVKLERFDVDLSQQRSGQDQRQQPDQADSRPSASQLRTPRPTVPVSATDANARQAPGPSLIQDRRLNVVI